MARLSLTGDTIAVDGVPWLTIGSSLPVAVVVNNRDLDDAIVLTATATRDLTFAPSGFAEPSVVVAELEPHPDRPDALRTFGFQYMEFALPSAGGADGHDLAPWPLRPAAAMPIVWGTGDGPVLLVGPLDAFHDQVMAVPSDERPRRGVACGWHGDLTEAPAGFAGSFVFLTAPDVRAAIAHYGTLLRDVHRAAPIGRYADPAVSALSYWTDNGATYYYRPEPGLDIRETILTAVRTLEAQGLPIAAVQLDSWFYPRAIPRPIADGAPVVPPSGATTWDGRPDAFPDGLGPFTRALGRPTVFHSRHLDASSPYFGPGKLEGWIDRDTGQAHGATPELFEIWMEQAASWGACTYEQDWLVEAFLTVGQLREKVGRADAWQQSIDRAAARRGLTLQWCMATPADFLASVHLRRLSSIRTNMDFDYAVDRPANWGWFLHVNALARALGLNTSKDVFLASRDAGGGYQDRLAEAETYLAAMSCGPVGIGDPIGATDAELVSRTCRPDGVLVMPDVPIAALAPSFLGDPMPANGPLAGETYSDHPAGRVHYLAAVAAPDRHGAGGTTLTVELAHLDVAHSDLASSGAAPAGTSPAGPPIDGWVARRWVDGSIRTGLDSSSRLDLDTGDRHLDAWVISPVLAGGRLAVFGDTTRYASMGDRRIGSLADDGDAVSLLVYGVSGEGVTVSGWSAGAAPSASLWCSGPEHIGAEVATAVRTAGPPGGWTVDVEVGIDGWTRLRVTA